MALSVSANRRSKPLTDAKAARNYCIWLLGRREYSRATLIKKMVGRELARDAAEAVADALASEGLQSDRRCAEAIKRAGERRGWSRRRIVQKLLSQGIDAGELEAFEVLDEDVERARSHDLFERWFAKTDGSYDAKRKVLARLARRGFPVGHLF